MIESLGIRAKRRRIDAGLSAISARAYAVLWLAYSRKDMLPGLPCSAVMTKMVLRGARTLAESEGHAGVPFVYYERFIHSLGSADAGRLREFTRQLVEQAVDEYVAVRVVGKGA